MTSSNIAQLPSQAPATEPAREPVDDNDGGEAPTAGHVDKLIMSMVKRAKKTPNYAADKVALDAITMAYVTKRTAELNERMRRVHESVAPLMSETDVSERRISDGQ